MFGRAARTVVDHAQYLSELDMIGDADFGINVSRGFEEVLEKLALLQNPDIGMILGTAGDVFVFDIGGTIGILLGRALQRAGKQMKGKQTLKSDNVVAILKTVLATIKEVGGAKVGDKTMVDALEPAVDAANSAVGSGIKDVQRILEGAAAAAREGAESTASMISRVGRSSYLGERSRDGIDPGAMLICLLLDAMKMHE
jgi:dihydroxyacetone kinase-like protein